MSSVKRQTSESVISKFFSSKEGKIATGLAVVGVAAAGGWYIYTKYYTKPTPKPEPVTFLTNDKDIKTVKLISKTQVNQDTYLFRFALPEGNVLGVPSGYHLYVHLPVESGEIKGKPYTPISLPTQEGHFDLLVKVYRGDSQVKAGNHTPQLEKLNEGAEISISGPIGKHEYQGEGNVAITKDGVTCIKKFSKISFVAGGSGITPFLSILARLQSLATDNTMLTLVYSNKTEADILQRKELDAAALKAKVKTVYTVTRQNQVSSDKINKGRVTAEFLKEHLPAPAEDHLVFHCGPAGFNTAVSTYLQELNYGTNAIKF